MATYKEEKEKLNAIKLNRKFDESSVPEFIKNYFCTLNSERGKLVYWSIVKGVILWLIEKGYIEKKSISDITPNDFNALNKEHILEYLQDVLDGGNKPNTVNTKKNCLAGFWKYLVNEELVENNILKNIPSAQFGNEDNNIHKIPTEDDLQEMVQNINKINYEFLKIRNLVIIKVLKETGILVSELLGLNLEDLYLNGTQPYITIMGSNSYYEDEKLKLYITMNVKYAFDEWIEVRNQVIKKDIDAVFLAPWGTRCSYSAIRNLLGKYSHNKISPQMLSNMYNNDLQRSGNVWGESKMESFDKNNSNNQYSKLTEEELKYKKIDILTQSFETLKCRIDNIGSDLSEIAEIINMLFVLDKKIAIEMWQYTLDKYRGYNAWNGNATYNITSHIIDEFINLFDIDEGCQLLKENSNIRKKLFRESYCVSNIFLKELLEKNKLYEFTECYEDLIKNENFLQYKKKDNLGKLIEKITRSLIIISSEGIQLLLEYIQYFPKDRRAIINVYLTNHMK